MILMKRIVRIGLFVLIGSIILILIANVWVISSTTSRVLTDYHLLPDSGVALVLGTSHRLTSGEPNPFFENRITSAGKLYREGKAIHFILSGDNRTPYYNEPMVMKKALMRQGVPESAITLDYAGLRTLDSIVRCKEIFGQDKIIIITQTFHSYRALFISDYYDLEAIALAANEPTGELAVKVFAREYLARTKAILDLYVLGTAPRHLGEKEPISL
jgi:SanA protein